MEIFKILDFNSHAHVERDGVLITTSKKSWIFQLTRSRGAWPFAEASKIDVTIDFNSHAHVERDYAGGHIPWRFGKFQLTRSRGAWRGLSNAKYLAVLFQLTRSRGAWQFVAGIRVHTHFISTHTLTWSVTFCGRWISGTAGISTHTLTWSVTVFHTSSTTIDIFQLTRSRGAWRYPRLSHEN